MVGLLLQSWKDSLSEINQFLLDGLESGLIVEGEYEDDAIDELVELQWQLGQGSDVCYDVSDTVLVFEHKFVLAVIELEDGCLLSLEHKVMIIDELVFGEASDEVGFAYSLLALNS